MMFTTFYKLIFISINIRARLETFYWAPLVLMFLMTECPDSLGTVPNGHLPAHLSAKNPLWPSSRPFLRVERDKWLPQLTPFLQILAKVWQLRFFYKMSLRKIISPVWISQEKAPFFLQITCVFLQWELGRNRDHVVPFWMEWEGNFCLRG